MKTTHWKSGMGSLLIGALALAMALPGCKKEADQPAAGGATTKNSDTTSTAPTTRSSAGKPVAATVPTAGGSVAVAVVTPKPGAPKPGAPTPESLKLAFVTNNASEFWKIAAAGVHKFEKESGVKVDILMPPSGKTEEQNQTLENLVSQGYNGIAVSVIAPDDQVNEVNDAAKKTNLITFDSDCAKSNRLAYIGTNNFEAGKALGAEIVKLLPNGGKIAIFVGTLAADNAKQRLGGIEDAIKGHNIEIVDKREDQTKRDKARSNVEDVINARPDLNLVVGLWSYNGPAIAAAIDGSGKKGKILAAVFDEEDDTLKGIEDGIISCTVVQKPFEFGYRSAKLLFGLATEGKSVLPPGGMDDTGVRVIDAKNAADFKAELAKQKAG